MLITVLSCIFQATDNPSRESILSLSMFTHVIRRSAIRYHLPQQNSSEITLPQSIYSFSIFGDQFTNRLGGGREARQSMHISLLRCRWFHAFTPFIPRESSLSKRAVLDPSTRFIVILGDTLTQDEILTFVSVRFDRDDGVAILPPICFRSVYRVLREIGDRNGGIHESPNVTRQLLTSLLANSLVSPLVTHNGSYCSLLAETSLRCFESRSGLEGRETTESYSE